ncbi:hypothetical protein GMI69_06635 [Eggerthellaceae bacterium zg-887]|uniref:DUF5979 domain-containing protein n=1 Tax=Xiamenia xianingshaonis TaxID=2682776 RepID=UPI00140B86EE|nr:DUF5979 domain-containing protein [Xiamenia xianingshaonis]NHM16334.1 hypothetical protein [Xiamenia xianingshaonis]
MARLKYPAMAALLALALLVLPLFASAALAAGSVDGSQQCSVAVSVPDDMPELATTPVTVSLYRVASMGDAGSLAATDRFASLDLNGAAYEDLDAAALADKAVACVTASASAEADATATVAGTATVDGLAPGLYLIMASPASTASATYTFSPSLVPLPTWDDVSQSWVYDNVEVELKASVSDRMASLEIVKTLKTMDASLGNPTFVFDVKAELDGKVVYANVAAVSFDMAGKKSVVLADCIPVGSTVTVTEAYSGASYHATTAQSQTITIGADNLAPQVFFENEPTGDRKHGTGIENAFSKGDGGWQLEQRTADTQEVAA